MKIKRLNEHAVMPIFATDGSAGMDLVSTSCTHTKDYKEYGTSLSFEIPEGHVGLLIPRSSISNNTDLMLCNSLGAIDSDFRGEVKVRFKSFGPRYYNVGDRVAQLIIVPYVRPPLEDVTELSNTKRGSGGFGSTG